MLLDGTGRTENYVPYALFGDTGPDFAGISPEPGMHRTEVAAYAGDKRQGGLLLEKSVRLEFVDDGDGGISQSFGAASGPCGSFAALDSVLF